MIVVIALPTALLCLLIAWMCLRRGYRRHALSLVLLGGAVVAFATSVVALCWIFWLKISIHFA